MWRGWGRGTTQWSECARSELYLTETMRNGILCARRIVGEVLGDDDE